MSFRTYTARWILTANGPPIENGILVVRDDKIEAVEQKGTRKADVDLGNVALIPGLVNAHTHLDLSGARGLIPPTDPEHFTDWLKGVIAFRRTRTVEHVQQDIREGLAECLKAGTTLIGDIASGGASWDSISSARIRGVVFYELIGLSYERAKTILGELLRWVAKVRNSHPNCRYGNSPHAPYSVENSFICAASLYGGQTAIHLGESSFEADFLERREGPFLEFLTELGVWPIAPESLAWPGQDVFFDSLETIIKATSSLMRSSLHIKPIHAEPILFIHGNYLPLSDFFTSNQFIVYCPRTHAAFRHPPHPFREFMTLGVRVCLGTDSLASNPDLDILAEARFVKQRYSDFDGETLLKMVTLFGAEALGWADECGSLEAGKSADAVAVPLPDRDGDPYYLLFVDPVPGQRRTMFRGEWRSP